MIVYIVHVFLQGSSGDVPQATATYYEDVGNVGRDAFTMKDNPSYAAPSSVSKC